MNITFGMFLDGTQWSEKSASLGEIICGPGAFLALLEQRTGLSGVEVSLPERINEYRAKIEAVDPEWCRASFQLDSWSTAKQMLALRDELYLNGWNGIDAPSERLKALAQIEANPLPLAPGVPDRIKFLLAELEIFTFSDTLYLLEKLELLPPYWQKIINRLEKCGMKIIHPSPEVKHSPQVIKVCGNNEYTLATELCRYLSAGNNQSTAVICEGKSEVLDGVLSRFGKGMIGNVQPSRWRESLQILPLWLETLWKPFNPLRFLELLLLPHSPIPCDVAKALVKALQEAPGIKGAEWQNGWNELLDSIRKNEHGFYKDIDAECKKISELQTFLETECFKYDANTGVLENTLIQRCEYLEKRLAPQIDKHPELAVTVSHAQTLKKIAVGKGLISKVALARMLDSIISTGTAPRTAAQQVTDFKVFANPGMLSGEFDTVLWWNCVDRGHSKNVNWSPAEIDVLHDLNRANLRKLENASWHKAKDVCSKEFIVFVPQIIEGEAVYPHPILDELAAQKPETLIDSDGNWKLGSRQTKLNELKPAVLKCKSFAKDNNIGVPRRLSYSQLSTFISCPRQWLMTYYLGLQNPAVMSLSSGVQMLGSLAHKVVEMLYSGIEKISEDEAECSAGRIFNNLIPEMAAEMLLDGRSVELKRFRETLIASVVSLVSEINKRRLLVKGCEKQVEGKFDGIDFIGYCDLYLEDEEGNPFVIDMKWSTTSYYEKNLKNNKALQLATYSWLLAPEKLDVQCAYYLFPKKKFICAPEADWQSLWSNARECWAERMKTLHAGTLEKGITEEKDLKKSNLPLALPAGCDFCDFAALCKIIGE